MAGSRLADKAILIAIGNAIQNLGIAAIGLFLVRIFEDKETYGAYRQVWLVVYSVMPLFLAGLPSAVYYFLPSLTRGRYRRYMRQGSWFLLAVGLLLAGVMYVASDWLAHFLKTPEIAPSIRAFALYPAFIAPSMMLFPFLVSTDLHRRAIVINLAFFLTQSVLIVALAAGGIELSTLFGVLVGLAAVRLLYSLVEVRRQTEPDAPEEPFEITLRANLAYSIPLMFSSLATVAGQRIDKIVVSASLGTEQYAVYDVGAVEFPGIVLVTMAATSVMQPHMSSLFHGRQLSGVHGFWRESLRKQSLITAPLVVFFGFFASEFIQLLYTPRYAEAATIFQFYLVVALFRTANPSGILLATGRTRTVLVGTISFLVLNLVLNLLLIGPLGMSGPPLATVIAMACLVGYYAFQSARALAAPILHMFPLALWLRVLAVSGAAGLAALPVRQLGMDRFPTLAVGSLVFGAVYVIVGGLTRTIRREDFTLAWRWVTLRGFRS